MKIADLHSGLSWIGWFYYKEYIIIGLISYFKVVAGNMDKHVYHVNY